MNIFFRARTDLVHAHTLNNMLSFNAQDLRYSNTRLGIQYLCFYSVPGYSSSPLPHAFLKIGLLIWSDFLQALLHFHLFHFLKEDFFFHRSYMQNFSWEHFVLRSKDSHCTGFSWEHFVFFRDLLRLRLSIFPYQLPSQSRIKRRFS